MLPLKADGAEVPGFVGLLTQSDRDEPEPHVQLAPAGPLLPNIADLRVSLTRVGTPHAHVAVLAADIGTTPERVREPLDK